MTQSSGPWLGTQQATFLQPAVGTPVPNSGGERVPGILGGTGASGSRKPMLLQKASLTSPSSLNFEECYSVDTAIANGP